MPRYRFLDADLGCASAEAVTLSPSELWEYISYMTLLEIRNQIPDSTSPIIKVIHKNDHFKVIALGFKQGVILRDHKSPLPAKLTVLEGSVRYKEPEVTLVLEKFHERSIPVHVIHSVEALEDSICLLTQG